MMMDMRWRERQTRQLRPCQDGCGKTGVVVAAAAGSTTVGVRLRLCTQADGMPGFCPFSSNLMGGPIITWSAMLVSRMACINGAPSAAPAYLKAEAATSNASKVNPALKQSTAKRKSGCAALNAASSACDICALGSAQGRL